MPSRFIAEVNETEPLYGSEYEGDLPLSAEQLHARHHKEMAASQAAAEAALKAGKPDDSLNIDYPEDEDAETPPSPARDKAPGKRGTRHG